MEAGAGVEPAISRVWVWGDTSSLPCNMVHLGGLEPPAQRFLRPPCIPVPAQMQIWSPRRVSNPYAFRQGILSPLCMPIPPQGAKV